MPSTAPIRVDLDVELSPHARQLLEAARSGNPMRGPWEVPGPGPAFQRVPTGASPAEHVRAWLQVDAAAIQAAGALAGAGGAVIVDAALTRLEGLADRVAQTEAERGALQQDLVALHGVAQREAAAATQLRANMRRIDAVVDELDASEISVETAAAVRVLTERIRALTGSTRALSFRFFDPILADPPFDQDAADAEGEDTNEVASATDTLIHRWRREIVDAQGTNDVAAENEVLRERLRRVAEQLLEVDRLARDGYGAVTIGRSWLSGLRRLVDGREPIRRDAEARDSE